MARERAREGARTSERKSAREREILARRTPSLARPRLEVLRHERSRGRGGRVGVIAARRCRGRGRGRGRAGAAAREEVRREPDRDDGLREQQHASAIFFVLTPTVCICVYNIYIYNLYIYIL